MKLVVLTIALPLAALADITGSVTLRSGVSGALDSLNLDTGKAATSGGDIVWDGSSIAPVGNVKLRNLGMLFSVQPASYYAEQVATATTTPIPASNLTTGDVFVVLTNGNNTARVEVLGMLPAGPLGGPEIILSFTTYVGVAPGVPLVEQVLNNSSQLPSYFPNYGIAPSSLFVITGAFLADPGKPVLQSSAPPGLPTSLNGASISVTVNGTTVHPAIYYTSPTQIAAVLPAATPTGNGTLTVTYNSKTSVAAPIKVIPAALGITTYAGEVGVATDAVSGALISFTNSGTPDEIITLWATGLGADPADSDTTFISSPHALGTPLQIYVGNDPATILYQGASVYPGVNQINVVIPSNALNGCFVPLVAIAGGVMANNVFLPINSGGECFDSVSGLHGSQLPVGGTQTLNIGGLTIIQTPDGKGGVTNVTTGSFQRYIGTFPANRPTAATCIINQPVLDVPSFSGLNVGTVTLTGPNSLNIDLPNQLGIKGAFYAPLSSTAIPPGGGAFTFTTSGGTDVGGFTGTVTISTPLISMTNANALTTIDRSQGFEVDWSGGQPGSFVYIGGASGSGKNSVEFTCTEEVAAGKLKIPAFLLSILPAGKGSLVLENAWSVPVTATGLDFGSVGADITVPTVTTTFN